ncbi:MAG: Rho termination factor N-terminal domain-containing protein [Myxococcales bacterium]|nr:Rho termination factor N-terminal domain-containing protein [Myxococcota bacterium]MDW8283450.1 Rho termination factor N-terminal domain-containing protein [Myxococcales bacterium]
MDWHELEKKKVSELREMAKEKTNLEGVSGMSKERLVEELAKVLGIHKPHKVAMGQEKSLLKARIRQVKARRAEALANKDAAALVMARRELRRLKHALRRHARRVLG